MAYNVYIERPTSGTPGQAVPILLDEWLAYVKADTEMCREEEATILSPNGESIKIKASGLARWTDQRTGIGAWFNYSRGRVSVEFPSLEILVKMYKVAVYLRAIVRGEGGEHYDDKGHPYHQLNAI